MASVKKRKRPRKAIPAKTSGPPKIVDVCDELLEMVRAQLAELRSKAGIKLEPRQRGTQLHQTVGMLMQIGKIMGDGLTEAQVLRAPSLLNVLEAVKRALAPHPAALAAVVEELEGLVDADERPTGTG